MITDPRRPIPLVWTVSKIEDSTPFGLTELKFTQETYSPILDNKELMICNYYDSSIKPKVPNVEEELKGIATITYSGTKPTIKVGGSFKTFTPTFSDESITVDRWIISDENGDISSDTDYIVEYDGDKLRLKVALNYNLIGKVLIIRLVGSDGSTAEVLMEVV